MLCEPLQLSGLIKITPQVHRDNRGFFLQTFHEPSYHKAGIRHGFAQDNHSLSTRHTIRGMHYQQAPGQAKLVRVALGRIFDVAVDIRVDSPTFGQWHGVYLDDQKHEQLYVPNGFAHGFCVISDIAHVLYKTSSIYDHAMERAFLYNDPQVNIAWPTETPIVSERDQQALPLAAIATGLPRAFARHGHVP